MEKEQEDTRRTTSARRHKEALRENMTEQALEARRAYKREWATRNPEQVTASQERFWQRKAKQAAEEQKPPENQTA